MLLGDCDLKCSEMVEDVLLLVRSTLGVSEGKTLHAAGSGVVHNLETPRREVGGSRQHILKGHRS